MLDSVGIKQYSPEFESKFERENEVETNFLSSYQLEVEESSLIDTDLLIQRKVALFNFNPLEIYQIKNKDNRMLGELKQLISCVFFDNMLQNDLDASISSFSNI